MREERKGNLVEQAPAMEEWHVQRGKGGCSGQVGACYSLNSSWVLPGDEGCRSEVEGTETGSVHFGEGGHSWMPGGSLGSPFRGEVWTSRHLLVERIIVCLSLLHRSR